MPQKAASKIAKLYKEYDCKYSPQCTPCYNTNDLCQSYLDNFIKGWEELNHKTTRVFDVNVFDQKNSCEIIIKAQDYLGSIIGELYYRVMFYDYQLIISYNVYFEDNDDYKPLKQPFGVNFNISTKPNDGSLD